MKQCWGYVYYNFENKISDLSGLATTNVLNTGIGEVENKIPDVSGLFKKTVSEDQISEIERKYFTTSGYNKFTSDILHAETKQNKLVDKSDLKKNFQN